MDENELPNSPTKPSFYSPIGILKKFKNWILLISVPLLLLPIFAGVDNRPTVCTPACTTFSDYKTRKNCELSHEYASTICKPRCIDMCFNVVLSNQEEANQEEAQAQQEAMTDDDFKKLSKDIEDNTNNNQPVLTISKNQECFDKYAAWKINGKAQANASMETMDAFKEVVRQRKNGECYLPEDGYDAMDFKSGDKDKKKAYWMGQKKFSQNIFQTG